MTRRGIERRRWPADILALLAELAEEIHELDRLEELRIVGRHDPGEPASLGLDRANAIRDRLVRNGVASEVLAVGSERTKGADAHHAWFDVIDCGAF